jgi:hypothetical protein
MNILVVDPIENRVCTKCDAAEPVIPTRWPHKKNKAGDYVPRGTICLVCEKARKAAYELRRDEIAAIVPPAEPEGSSTDGKPKDRKALKDEAKLDAARALKTGSRVINDIAPAVLARLEAYANDEDSEYHYQALEFFAARIAPKRLYEELGGEAAGLGALSDKRPIFQVNILPAHPVPEGRVLSGDLADVTEVQVLPAAIP